MSDNQKEPIHNRMAVQYNIDPSIPAIEPSQFKFNQTNKIPSLLITIKNSNTKKIAE